MHQHPHFHGAPDKVGPRAHPFFHPASPNIAPSLHTTRALALTVSLGRRADVAKVEPARVISRLSRQRPFARAVRQPVHHAADHRLDSVRPDQSGVASRLGPPPPACMAFKQQTQRHPACTFFFKRLSFSGGRPFGLRVASLVFCAAFFDGHLFRGTSVHGWLMRVEGGWWSVWVSGFSVW